MCKCFACFFLNRWENARTFYLNGYEIKNANIYVCQIHVCCTHLTLTAIIGLLTSIHTQKKIISTTQKKCGERKKVYARASKVGMSKEQ